MKCPIDGATLQMADKKGIEIDYCPDCRGIWLDRGELEKIIERSNEYNVHDSSKDDYRQEDRRSYREYDDKHKKKRGGFLGDLLDFGD